MQSLYIQVRNYIIYKGVTHIYVIYVYLFAPYKVYKILLNKLKWPAHYGYKDLFYILVSRFLVYVQDHALQRQMHRIKHVLGPSYNV